jgi:hypothetical protein
MTADTCDNGYTILNDVRMKTVLSQLTRIPSNLAATKVSPGSLMASAAAAAAAAAVVSNCIYILVRRLAV